MTRADTSPATFWHCRRATTYIEMALALPLLFYILLGMINFSLVSVARTMSGLAVSEGARIGSVQFEAGSVQSSAVTAVGNANKLWLGAAGSGCATAPQVWSAGNVRVNPAAPAVGSVFTVTQDWCVTNFFGGLAGLWGGNPDTSMFHGEIKASAVKEGW